MRDEGPRPPGAPGGLSEHRQGGASADQEGHHRAPVAGALLVVDADAEAVGHQRREAREVGAPGGVGAETSQVLPP